MTDNTFEERNRIEKILKARAENAKSGIKYEWSYLEELMKVALERKSEQSTDLHNLLHHVLLLCDLGEDLVRQNRDKGETVLVQNKLIVRDWLDFMFCLFHGGYSGAARTLRWLLESTICSSVATIDGEKLTGNPKNKGIMSMKEFRNWLRLYDERKAHLNIKRVLKALGFASVEVNKINRLYGKLCKRVHLSRKTFAEEFTQIPDLTFEEKEFDEIYNLAIETMDVVICSLIKGYSSAFGEDEVRRFLDAYRNWFVSGAPEQPSSVRERNFPLTTKLIDNIIKST